MTELLKINHLEVQFRTAEQVTKAVNGIHFSVKRGEIYALVGESGCGKSLTALSIMQLLPSAAEITPHSDIQFAGEDILAFSEVQMRKLRGKRISMIFQEPMTSLNPVLIVGEQIDEVLRLHENLTAKARYQKTIELLKIVGISDPETRYHAYPHQLSGGMKQRIMIALALVCRPDLLIADEPTTALDVTIQAQILQLLAYLRETYQMSILLITHDLGVVKQMADRVGVMYAGELIEEREVSDFFAAPQHRYSQQLLDALPTFEKRGKPLVTTKDEIISPSIKTLQKNTSQTLLRVNQLAIHFPIRKGVFQRIDGWVRAVDGVNFSLDVGKILAIVGESGCGKTSIAKGLLQLVPISGEIFFEKKSLTQLSHSELRASRRERQIVFQDPYSTMNPRWLMGELMEEGLLTHEPSLSSSERKKRVQKLLEQVGIPGNAIYRYPHEFSGGQRQRINVARALSLHPKLIICDEPTSALDVSVQAHLLNLLKNLQQQYQLSYLFITHNMGVVGYFADDIAVMYLGRMVEQGTVADVLTAPQHPYTQLLLSTVPTQHSSRMTATMPILQEQPSPIYPPSGCHFHPRCPHVMPICREHYPATTQLTTTRTVNCFLYDKKIREAIT